MRAVFTFTLSRVPTESEAARLSSIPGVRLRGVKLTAPLHAAWIVDAELRALALLAVRVDAPTVLSAPAWDSCVSSWTLRGEVRPWVYDFTLPYQREGIATAVGRRSCHLWWPGGSGKTLAAILWALYEPGPVVIVTKAATRLQYASEIARFTYLRACVLQPGAKETPEAYLARCAERGDRPVFIVGWQGLPAYTDTLRALSPGAIVFDEAHTGKSSKRRKATLEADGSWSYADLDNIVTAAARLARSSWRRLATTATPIKDRRRDLWGQLDLVQPGEWGGFNPWAKRYCGAKPGAFGGWDTTGTSHDDELVGRLSFVAHRVSYAQTHRELPAKRRQSRYLGPDEQNAPSGGWDAELRRASARGASALLEVRLAESASRKRKAIVGMVEEQIEGTANAKVVIFTGRHRDCDALGTAVKKSLPTVTAFVAHGGNTTPETREAVRTAYMDHPGPCVLIGTGDAWGTGYNLHDTDLAIFAMLPWTGGDLHQWEQRFSRLGQKRPVLLLYAICEGSVDEQIADRLIGKIADMGAITGDDETVTARDALGGTDDREALAVSILARLADREIEVDDD